MADEPMSESCNDIDTSRPMIPHGIVLDMVIKDAKKDKSKTKTDDGSEREVIGIQWQPTSETLTDHRGEVVNSKMITVFQHIAVTETAKRPIAAIKRDIAEVAKAVGKGNLSWKDILANPAVLKDGIARVKVKIRPETPEFPEANAIAAFPNVK